MSNICLRVLATSAALTKLKSTITLLQPSIMMLSGQTVVLHLVPLVHLLFISTTEHDWAIQILGVSHYVEHRHCRAGHRQYRPSFHPHVLILNDHRVVDVI